MSVHTLKFGSEEENARGTAKDIPPDTKIMVVSLPGHRLVWKGEATRSFSHDFDPGKYRYSMMKFVSPKSEGVPNIVEKVVGDFLVDITEEQFNRLKHIEPRMVRTRMVSGGNHVWACRVPGCKSKVTNRIAAVIHESKEHLNVDLLKDPSVDLHDLREKSSVAAQNVQSKRIL